MIELMLTHSDNAATDALISNLGGPETVQTWLNFNGLDGIHMTARSRIASLAPRPAGPAGFEFTNVDDQPASENRSRTDA